MCCPYRKKMRTIKLFLIGFSLLLSFPLKSFTQQNLLVESYVRNSYIPRGFIGTKDPTIEGSVTYSLSPSYRINFWGISSLVNRYSEIDLTMEYQYKNFTISLIDYYNPSSNQTFNYFNLKKYNTTHTLDLILFYRLNNAFPLGLKWSSYVYGYDHDPATDDRFFSTYLELSYPVIYRRYLFNPYIGFVPWKSWYTSQPAVVNCGVKLDTDLLCSENTCLPATFNMIYNPKMEQFNVNLILGFQLRNKGVKCCSN